jgi:hypothetical protein
MLTSILLAKNAWFTVELDRSIPRLSHTSTRVGSYLFVIGGHDGKQYSSEVLLLNLGRLSILYRVYRPPKRKCLMYLLLSDHELGDTKHSWDWTNC